MWIETAFAFAHEQVAEPKNVAGKRLIHVREASGMRITSLRRSGLLAIVATAAIFGLLSFSAYSADSSAAPAFNGTSLAGWHSQGSGNWKAEHGEIVGTGSDGWLFLDHGYEDFMVRFAFQCNN